MFHNQGSDMHTKYFISIFFMTFLVLFVGCQKKKTSPLLNEKLTPQNFFELVGKVKKDTLITAEEIELFSSGVGRYSNFVDSLFNKSVKQIIDQERTLRRRQSYVNLATNAIVCYSRFRYDGWKPIEIDGSKFNVFTYTISNISKNDIDRIQGYLQFFTTNNQLIRAYRINVDQTIKAGQFTQFQSTFRAEENNQNELLLVKLLKENPNTVFVTWRPMYLELDNGQKIDLEEK